MFRYHLFTIIFFTSIIYSQSETKETQYDKDLGGLVTYLIKDQKTDLEKAHSIYLWITDNISYDYKAFYRKRKSKIFKCSNPNICQSKLIKWETDLAEKTFKKRKGLCSGYAHLFKRMCLMAGLNCTVINGYIKNKPQEIGKMGNLDHAWNSIVLNSEYYYADLTWATGYCTTDKNDKLNGFVRKRTDYYWLTPIDKLSRDHFPKDTLQLVNSSYNTKLYKENIYIRNSLMSKIDVLSPKSGIVKAKVGDTIKLNFRYPELPGRFQINTNINKNPKVWKYVDGEKMIDEKMLGRQKYVVHKKQNDIYSLEYIVRERNVRFVEVLFDFDLALKFLIRVVD